MVLAELKYAVATLARPTSAILARPSAVSSTLLDLMSLRKVVAWSSAVLHGAKLDARLRSTGLA
jgi:hypothetical protein